MSQTITAKEAGKYIDEIISTLEKPQAAGVLGQWNDILAGDLGKGFLSSESPDGEKWAPLKHPRPLPRNQGTRPLIDTGDLMRSVTSDGKGHIEIVTDTYTMFGTDIEYAAVQNFGTKPGTTPRIPARPFMGVPEKTLIVAAEMIGEHIFTKIAAL